MCSAQTLQRLHACFLAHQASLLKADLSCVGTLHIATGVVLKYLRLPLAEGIKLAEADGVDWVFHVDTDELMYPASAAEYSLQVCHPACKQLGQDHESLMLSERAIWTRLCLPFLCGL